ncbi:MAG: NAD(P)-dependent oxidoreductase, partial [Oscillospiraceae bacterium]|nr:NAD(P)-dependent oxidoreductase [Oscillospiraceae bacterium]
MKIVLLDAYAANPGDLSWDGLREFGEVTVYDRTAPEDVLTRIGDAEVVYVNKVRLDGQTLRQCKNLKLVSVLATGYNVVDTAAAKELGILVCNSPSYSTASVAQLTIAHLLELCSHVGALSDACHSGRWAACPDFCFWDAPLMELSGKTMGIIGYGTIGRAVGAIAQALGTRLLVNARHSDPALESPTCRYAPLEELLAQSDVVTLHCPQTPETTGLIDRARIAQMKDGAI